jgi:hypothetical protein
MWCPDATSVNLFPVTPLDNLQPSCSEVAAAAKVSTVGQFISRNPFRTKNFKYVCTAIVSKTKVQFNDVDGNYDPRYGLQINHCHLPPLSPPITTCHHTSIFDMRKEGRVAFGTRQGRVQSLGRDDDQIVTKETSTC